MSSLDRRFVKPIIVELGVIGATCKMLFIIVC